LEYLHLAIHKSGELAGRVDLQEFRRLVFAFCKIDGNDLIVRSTLVEHPFCDRRATFRIVIELHRITSYIERLCQEVNQSSASSSPRDCLLTTRNLSLVQLVDITAFGVFFDKTGIDKAF